MKNKQIIVIIIQEQPYQMLIRIHYAAVYHWTRNFKKFLGKPNPYFWFGLGLYIAFEVIILQKK